jgi:plasmid maintenance system antidote protein VapI
MRPVHLGDVLREDYMIPLGLSANALARELGVAEAEAVALSILGAKRA